MNINLTLIGQSITFFLFVWFTMKFVWPPILKALEERKAKIADGLAAAERGVHEQALAQQRATEVLKEAKQQAAKIIGQAEAATSCWKKPNIRRRLKPRALWNQRRAKLSKPRIALVKRCVFKWRNWLWLAPARFSRAR